MAKDRGPGAYEIEMRPPDDMPQSREDDGRQLMERITFCAVESEAHARSRAVEHALGLEAARGCVYRIARVTKID